MSGGMKRYHFAPASASRADLACWRVECPAAAVSPILYSPGRWYGHEGVPGLRRLVRGAILRLSPDGGSLRPCGGRFLVHSRSGRL